MHRSISSGPTSFCTLSADGREPDLFLQWMQGLHSPGLFLILTNMAGALATEYPGTGVIDNLSLLCPWYLGLLFPFGEIPHYPLVFHLFATYIDVLPVVLDICGQTQF